MPQTSVKVEFFARNSSDSSALTGTLIDNRNHLILNLNYSGDVSEFINAQVLIDASNATSTTTLKSYNLTLGQNFIGTPLTVSAHDIRHNFTDLNRYSIKVKAVTNDGSVKTFYSQYSTDSSESNYDTSYEFLFRSDGGDVFDIDANCVIMNPNEIEGIGGNLIKIKCPLVTDATKDARVPSRVLFTFDEIDNYDGTVNDTDNSEQLSECSFLVDYNISGEYELMQDSDNDNHLKNDASYAVSVTAMYENDGHTVSKTLNDLVTAVASPVIDHVVAYGLSEDQADAEDPTVSSVMNVYLTEGSNPVKILPTSGNVTFNLSQDNVVFYSAVMPVSSTKDNDNNYVYTILKEDLSKIWTTTPPEQNADKSYTYGVTALIEYALGSVNISKTSNVVTKPFTSDINQLDSVTLSNAWMTATNVGGTGNRIVDYSDTLTKEGYDVAPELGMVAIIPKNDFYGSGIAGGQFQDLDTIDGVGNPTTNHKFMISTEGENFTPVTMLYQIQGDTGKTHQENIIKLLKLPSSSVLEDENGIYPNIPGPSGVKGSLQPSIYVWIPNSNGFAQEDSVKISVAILPPAGLTTRPAATESDQVIAVNKINRYEMIVGSESEPKFTGTGADGELVVPINNSTGATGDLYFYSAIFESNLSSPNDNVVKYVSNDGVFDITISNPSIRGTSTTCDYTVAYKISDPNDPNGWITGPKSDVYSIYLKDEPTNNNFTVTNFSYKTFNDYGESSFKFDIAFSDVGTTSIEGVNVYFSSNNDDVNTSNDIPETLVLTVKRLDGDSQSNLTVTLQATAPATSALSDGVNILNYSSSLSSNTWKNFRSGTVIIKPYYTAKVTSSDDPAIEIENAARNFPILNIPMIEVPANVSLTGGVIESYKDTTMDWDNDLSDYSSASSSTTASYDLKLNGVDKTADITGNNSYTIDLGSTYSAYTLNLRTKISSKVDANIYYSKPVVVEFDSVSVDQSGVTVDAKRGSNDVNLNTQFNSYSTSPSPASNLNVTEVKVVSDATAVNTDPEDEGVKVLTCTSTVSSVQPDNTVHSYDLAEDGYEQADKMNLKVRMEAGVDYSLKYGDSSASNEESTPLYLELASYTTPYVVATKPSVTILDRSHVSSGTYNGQTALSFKLNGNGIKNEGAQSVIVIMVTEGDYTDANNGSGSGAEIILAFESTNARLRSYTVGSDASLTVSSTDNLGAGEVHVLSVDDTNGFSESTSTGDFTLVMGDLDNNDTSTLYMPADCEFTTAAMSVVVVGSTRLGTDVDMKQLNALN